jgi:hypothetical protein
VVVAVAIATKQQQQVHSSAVNHIKGTPAMQEGIVDGQPDARAAIKARN